MLCGVAGIALAAPVIAKDLPVAFVPGTVVDFDATVSAVREVPAGNALPGLHVDVKVKGRTVDVYIAPIQFVQKYGVKVAKGDDVRIEGTESKVGQTEVVLARSITTGSFDNRSGAFRADLTVYLRNDDGPFWVDPPSIAPAPLDAH